MTRSALETVTLYIERIWNEGRDDLIPELCADPIVRHDPNALTSLRHAEQRARIRHNYDELRPVFTWEVLATWKSPRSGANYPSRVKLTSTDPDSHQPVTFLLEPLVADQELTNALGGGPYWEGACRVSDGAGREIGSAYLELTGYAKALSI